MSTKYHLLFDCKLRFSTAHRSLQS